MGRAALAIDYICMRSVGGSEKKLSDSVTGVMAGQQGDYVSGASGVFTKIELFTEPTFGCVAAIS